MTDPSSFPFPHVVITAINRKWCENHFTCIGCNTDIAGIGQMKYMDWDSKPMCKDCYTRVSGDIRKQLTKYIENEKKVTKQGDK